MICFSEIHSRLLVWAPWVLRFAAGVELLCIVLGIGTRSVSLFAIGAIGLAGVALSYRVVKLAAQKPPPSTRIAAYFVVLLPLFAFLLAIATHVKEFTRLTQGN